MPSDDLCQLIYIHDRHCALIMDLWWVFSVLNAAQHRRKRVEFFFSPKTKVYIFNPIILFYINSRILSVKAEGSFDV